MASLEQRFSSEIKLVNEYLESLIVADSKVKGLQVLSEAIRYSLNNPGKRFRALLSLLTARSLGHELNLVLPYAAAVEFIHTYSLIHDDLPAMDDDDLRRGQPSNHKVYGEAMAIVAGDALQAEAFQLIADNYQQTPQLALRAVGVLAEASGRHGMVGGQAVDLMAQQGFPLQGEEVRLLHDYKTGALIRSATEGAAILCGANEQQVKDFRLFGQSLGLAFQIADDLLDHDEQNPEASGFPVVFGLDKTKETLKSVTDLALESLQSFANHSQDLQFITEFNYERTL